MGLVFPTFHCITRLILFYQTASAPFSIVATGTTSEFTLRLTGSLASVTSPVTLMLDVVDSGTSGMPSRTAAVTLTLTIDARKFVFHSPYTLFVCIQKD